MKTSSFILSALFLIFTFIPLNSNAIPVGAGDIIRVDFDLSLETPAPPYEGIYTVLGFGSADYLNLGEGFSIALFDEDGAGLSDGTGYFVIYDVVGTFELDYGQAAGRFYDGSLVTDTTAYVNGALSSMSALPDVGNSLATPFSFTNTVGENISWFGHDRIFLVPEPTVLLLFAIGLLGFALLKGKRR